MTLKQYPSDESVAERYHEEINENIRNECYLIVDKPGYRQGAARIFIRLADFWGLSQTSAAALLHISTAEYRAWHAGREDSLSPDSLAKISCLLGIYKYLCTLYSGDLGRVESWFCRELPIDPFCGQTPFDLLVGADVSVFLSVRRYLAGWTV